jgi:hypothetical protein
MKALGLVVAISLLIVALAASASCAGTISSDNFSLAYGATGTSGVGEVFYGWTTTENTAGNTPTTQGDFTFQPAPFSDDPFCGFGSTFVGRVLANGDGGSWSAYAGNFAVPIVASYTGAAPADASATPNYRLSLNITKISVYGAAYFTNAQTTMLWDETTPGNVRTQPSSEQISLNVVTATSQLTIASNFKQLSWNAGDYSVSLANLGDTVTRTFAILPGDFRVLEGLEIEGNVTLQYNSVPEPSTVVLLATGAIGLLACAWRKRK